MSWNEKYNELLERDKQMFTDCVNKLLAQNYIVFQNEGDRQYYRFIDRHATLFEEYLRVMGWNIEFVKAMTLIYVHNPTGRNRRMLTQNQTLFLFILRLIFEERQKDITLARHVSTTNEEIHEKYLALKIKNRLPNVDEYGKILKLFASYSLIEVKKGCWNHPQEPIILYPSILIAVPVHAVEAYHNWIVEGSESEEIDHEILEETEIN